MDEQYVIVANKIGKKGLRKKYLYGDYHFYESLGFKGEDIMIYTDLKKANEDANIAIKFKYAKGIRVEPITDKILSIVNKKLALKKKDKEFSAIEIDLKELMTNKKKLSNSKYFNADKEIIQQEPKEEYLSNTKIHKLADLPGEQSSQSTKSQSKQKPIITIENYENKRYKSSVYNEYVKLLPFSIDYIDQNKLYTESEANVLMKRFNAEFKKAKKDGYNLPRGIYFSIRNILFKRRRVIAYQKNRSAILVYSKILRDKKKALKINNNNNNSNESSQNNVQGIKNVS